MTKGGGEGDRAQAGWPLKRGWPKWGGGKGDITQGRQPLGNGQPRLGIKWWNSRKMIIKKKTITTKGDEQD